MLTKITNQPNQKLVNIMTYKVYTHRHNDTQKRIDTHLHTQTQIHVYVPLFHITTKVSLCFNINI